MVAAAVVAKSGCRRLRRPAVLRHRAVSMVAVMAMVMVALTAVGTAVVMATAMAAVTAVVMAVVIATAMAAVMAAIIRQVCLQLLR
jgi:hypothetical protein